LTEIEIPINLGNIVERNGRSRYKKQKEEKAFLYDC